MPDDKWLTISRPHCVLMRARAPACATRTNAKLAKTVPKYLRFCVVLSTKISRKLIGKNNGKVNEIETYKILPNNQTCIFASNSHFMFNLDNTYISVLFSS